MRGDIKDKIEFLGGEEYIVSWAFGHLLALIDIEDYGNCPSRKSKYSWTMEGLPFFPEKFEFQLRKDRKAGKIDSGDRSAEAV